MRIQNNIEGPTNITNDAAFISSTVSWLCQCPLHGDEFLVINYRFWPPGPGSVCSAAIDPQPTVVTVGFGGFQL
jgi:hypothetical protein